MRVRLSLLPVFVLSLMLFVGCDVRPFSDLADDDGDLMEEDNSEESETNIAPMPTAPAIVTVVDTPETSQIDPNDPDAGQMHTYAISMEPENGTATVSEDGVVTYTPDTSFVGEDDLEVTVTDDGDPPMSDVVTIMIQVTAS